MKHIIRIIFLISLSSLLVQCQQKQKETKSQVDEKLTPAQSCPISGPYPAWENLYCRMKTGITNRTSKALRPCETEVAGETFKLPDCDKVKYIKEKVCKIQTELGYIKIGYRNCLKSKELEQTWLKEYLNP